MSSGKSHINQIHYNQKLQHPSEQQVLPFQQKYAIRTHPSFQSTQQKRQNFPGHQNKPKKQVDQYTQQDIKLSQKHGYSKKPKMNKTLQQKSSKQTNKLIFSHNQKQNLEMKSQLRKLAQINRQAQEQNQKLRKYVDFLQDYNLKLKKQLMTAMRRRTLEDDFGLNYHQNCSNGSYQNPRAFQEMHLPKQVVTNSNHNPNIYQSYKQVRNNLNNQNNPQYVGNYGQPELHSNPYFQNLLINNYNKPFNFSNTFVDSYSDKKHKIPQNTQYIREFYQKPEQEIYYNSLRAKKNMRKVREQINYPSSLQVSSLGIQKNYLNPQNESKNEKLSNLSKKINYLNISMPVVKDTHKPNSNNHQLLSQSLNKGLDDDMNCSARQSVICPQCFHAIHGQQNNQLSFQVLQSKKNKPSINSKKVKNTTQPRNTSSSLINDTLKRNDNCKKSTKQKTYKYSSAYQRDLTKKLQKSSGYQNSRSIHKSKFKVSEFRI